MKMQQELESTPFEFTAGGGAVKAVIVGTREFKEIVVSHPKSAGGLPYYSIRYKEDDEEYEGYGTFDPKILSGYLSKYFFSPFSTDKPSKEKENPCNDCEHRKTWCMGFLCKEALEYLDGEDEDARQKYT